MRLVTKINEFAGSAMLILALLAAPVYAYEVHWEHQQAACSRAQAATFTEALSARSGPSNARQDAVDAVLDQVSELVLSPPTKDPKVLKQRADTYLKVFRDYRTAKAAAAVNKTQNPLPTFPRC